MTTNKLTHARELFRQQRFSDAVEIYQDLIFKEPLIASHYLEMASCMMVLGQHDEALVVVKQGMNYADEQLEKECRLQLARIYLIQKRYDQAAMLLEGLILAGFSKFDVYITLSSLHLQTGFPSKALDVLDYASDTWKSSPEYLLNHSLALFQLGECDEALAELIRHCQSNSTDKRLLSNAMMYLSYSVRRTEYMELLKDSLKRSYLSDSSGSNRLAQSGKIKVGFVSADFNLHPVGYFINSFLGELNRFVDIYLFSNSDHIDSLTLELQKKSKSFISLVGLGTLEAAERIKSHQIEILIDLSGHTAGNRLDVFHLRAAPYQLSYLGYPESTHLPNMDGLITDMVHIPAHESSTCSEQVWYLPTSRFCFLPPRNFPAISAAPIIENSYLTLANFGNPAKISRESATNWLKILQAIPNSRLKLRHQLWQDSGLKQKFEQLCSKMSIPKGSIEFYGASRYDGYLEAYHEVDLILDSYPFTGGTTTFEALWMGVPVLTIPGITPASRQTASILKALNEDEWMASSADEAIRIIQSIHSRPELLSNFKARIRQKLVSTSLGNPVQFAKDFYEILSRIQSQMLQSK